MTSDVLMNDVENIKAQKRGKNKNLDIKTDNDKYSKTLKVGKVETFEWKYEDKVWNP